MAFDSTSRAAGLPGAGATNPAGNGPHAVPPGVTPATASAWQAATSQAAADCGCPSPGAATASGGGGPVDAASTGVANLSASNPATDPLGSLRDSVRTLATAVKALVQSSGGTLQPGFQAALDGLGPAGGPTGQAIAATGGGTDGASAAGAASSPVQSATPTSGGGTVQSAGARPLDAGSRASAIPELTAGQPTSLRLGTGQVSYRRVTVTGPASFDAPTSSGGLGVQSFALRDYAKGAQRTQVLEPVSGHVDVPAGHSMQVLVRLQGTAAGSQQVDVAGTNVTVDVSAQKVTPLPMMAWINESDATKHGADPTNLAKTLANFGVSATGNSGLAVVDGAARSPVQYYSVAYDAANRTSPAEAAKHVLEAEAKAKAANPNAQFWVQVSDEQDTTADAVNGTVSWIGQLKAQLAAQGSSAKLFVAAQAKPMNLAYATVVDGWATTQSAAGQSRDQSIAQIRQAAAGAGHDISLLEYPGNAFFDAGTAGGAAVSTATAALDGAQGWFIYSSNNQSTLESGSGDEAKGDIGGLVVVDQGGRVLPTISLVEAELGASIGAAARATGATASSGATQVAGVGDQLDAYRHDGTVPQLALLEQQAAAGLS